MWAFSSSAMVNPAECGRGLRANGRVRVQGQDLGQRGSGGFIPLAGRGSYLSQPGGALLFHATGWRRRLHPIAA